MRNASARPRRSIPPVANDRPVDASVLHRVRFTKHAVERFAERAALPQRYTAGRLEAIMRDLLLQEGRIVVERPHWARSRNDADGYLQAGEWLLFVCRQSRGDGLGWDVVTVVNGAATHTWERAREREYIGTPPPLQARAPQRRRAGWWQSVRQAHRDRPAGRKGFLRSAWETHRAQKQTFAAEYEQARRMFEQRVQEHRSERSAAREAHVRRYGSS
jgi:hypothetical protein